MTTATNPLIRQLQEVKEMEERRRQLNGDITEMQNALDVAVITCTDPEILRQFCVYSMHEEGITKDKLREDRVLVNLLSKKMNALAQPILDAFQAELEAEEENEGAPVN